MVYELQVWFHLLTRSYTYVIAFKLYFLIHRKIVCSTISAVLLPGDFGPNRSHHRFHCTCASLQATFVYLEPWETNQVITAFPSRRPSWRIAIPENWGIFGPTAPTLARQWASVGPCSVLLEFCPGKLSFSHENCHNLTYTTSFVATDQHFE